VRSKTDGSWIITASRRVDGADGSFAGIVVATISLDMFRQAYEKIHVGQQGSVTLLYGDGIIVVRAPFRESDIGRNVSGSAWLRDLPKLATPAAVEFTSVLDGIYRLGAAQRVPDQPLVLLVARDRHDVLAGWRRDVTGQLLILAVAVGVLAFVGGCIAVLVREKLKAEALYRLVSDHSSDAIVCMSPNGRWRYVSPAFLGLTGYPANELREMRWNDLVHPDDRAVVQDALSGLETGSGQAVCTYRHICRNGQAVWVEARAKTVADDNGAELVVNIRDIRERRAVEEQLSRANAELMALSMTDGLTGLANRRRFDQRLAIEIGRAAAERHDLALLLIDIDHFKFYNDGYGHPAGDYALQTVARCLDGVIHRPDDLVARYGGEEFVSILPDTHAAGASHVAERIRAAIHDAAITHAGSPTGFVTVSIGIAAARPGDAAALDRLVLDADAALYCAKRGGRDQVIVAGMRDGEPSRAGAPSAEHGELH
jgi:diguanylate cyclase (GGDEF)-like protein/PAS domain S-box-containing protein